MSQNINNYDKTTIIAGLNQYLNYDDKTIRADDNDDKTIGADDNMETHHIGNNHIGNNDIKNIHYHRNKSYKPSVAGVLIGLGGGAAMLTVVALSAAHLIPGITSPLGYVALTTGSVAIIVGLGLVFGDRLLAYKRNKNYINLVNTELQAILKSREAQKNESEDLVGALKELKEKREAAEKDTKFCALHTSSGGLRMVLLQNAQGFIDIHIFNFQDGAEKKFFNQVQKT